MANQQLRRLLRRRPEMDEAEFELLQTRVLSRLTAAYDNGTESAAENGTEHGTENATSTGVETVGEPEPSAIAMDAPTETSEPIVAATDVDLVEPATVGEPVAKAKRRRSRRSTSIELPASAVPVMADPVEPSWDAFATDIAEREGPAVIGVMAEPTLTPETADDASVEAFETLETVADPIETVGDPVEAPDPVEAVEIHEPVEAVADRVEIFEPVAPSVDDVGAEAEAILAGEAVVADVLGDDWVEAPPAPLTGEVFAATDDGFVVDAADLEAETAVLGEPPDERPDPGFTPIPDPMPATIEPAARPRRQPPPRPAGRKPAPRPAVIAASCPYCALLLQPPPEASRRCPRCRERIIVKRVDGRVVYLTEASLLVFDAERRRIANSGRWTRERERWLKVAAAAGAPPSRIARLGAATLSEEVVTMSRTLYLTTVERSFRSAKRDRRWEDASRIMRDHAMVMYRADGSPLPPSEDVVLLHREGVASALRGIGEMAREAELVSAGCCDICVADDGRTFRITAELRTPRLPHDGCPKGLCRCDWYLAVRDQTMVRRHLRRRARGESVASGAESPSP